MPSSQYSSHSRYVCIAIHDVSPATWPLCQRLLAAVHEIAEVPVTLLVVPEYHQGPAARQDAKFISAMNERLACGDELALHGLRHWDDQRVQGPLEYARRRIYTASEGEFAALSVEQARDRLVSGMKWFRENDWPLHGFVAPAWLMSDGTLRALSESHLSYTTTLKQIILLPENQAIVAPCFTYSTRSAWRRGLSGVWNEWLTLTSQPHSTIRLALHPNDAQYPKVMAHWQKIIAKCLESRRPVTKAAFVTRIRERYVSRRFLPFSIG